MKRQAMRSLNTFCCQRSQLSGFQKGFLYQIQFDMFRALIVLLFFIFSKTDGLICQQCLHVDFSGNHDYAKNLSFGLGMSLQVNSTPNCLNDPSRTPTTSTCSLLCVSAIFQVDLTKYTGPPLDENINTRDLGLATLVYRDCLENLIPSLSAYLGSNIPSEAGCFNLDAQAIGANAAGRICLCRPDRCNTNNQAVTVTSPLPSNTGTPSSSFSHYACAAVTSSSMDVENMGLAQMWKTIPDVPPLSETCPSSPPVAKKSCSTSAYLASVNADLKNYRGPSIYFGSELSPFMLKMLGVLNGLFRGCLDSLSTGGIGLSSMPKDSVNASVSGDLWGVHMTGSFSSCTSAYCNGPPFKSAAAAFPPLASFTIFTVFTSLLLFLSSL